VTGRGNGRKWFDSLLQQSYVSPTVLAAGGDKMFLGFLKDNKENIFYTILTVFLLERVRTRWNRIESEGRRAGTPRQEVDQRQRVFATKAAALYALPFLLPVLKYIYRSIDELSWSVQGLAVLKNLWAFLTITVLVECFICIVIYNLLLIYIDRMNAALGFFAKIGRNIYDGSKSAIQMSGDMGSRVVTGIRRASSSAVRRTRKAASTSARRAATRAATRARELGARLPGPIRRPVAKLGRLARRRLAPPPPLSPVEEARETTERAVVNR